MKYTSTSVLYVLMVMSFVFMVGAMTQQALETEETIVVHAKDVEPLSYEEELPPTTITVGEVRVISKSGLQSPTPSPKPLSIEQMIVEELGEGGLEVAMCESSLNPKAKSKISTAKGLFQIINGTWKLFKCTGDPLNAEDNIKCASKIYNHTGGWNTSGGWKASHACHQQN